jgi:hypothetical protein
MKKSLILFEYNKSRGQDPPREMLKNFNGTLQTDDRIGKSDGY